jgi:hypothetical protein
VNDTHIDGKITLTWILNIQDYCVKVKNIHLRTIVKTAVSIEMVYINDTEILHRLFKKNSLHEKNRVIDDVRIILRSSWWKLILKQQNHLRRQLII